jgi:hypothetical protein
MPSDQDHATLQRVAECKMKTQLQRRVWRLSVEKKDKDDSTGPTEIIPANTLSARSLRHRHPTLELTNYQSSSTLPLGCYTKSANWRGYHHRVNLVVSRVGQLESLNISTVEPWRLLSEEIKDFDVWTWGVSEQWSGEPLHGIGTPTLGYRSQQLLRCP